MKLSDYEILPEHRMRAHSIINRALTRENVADFDNDESKDLFVKFAQFCLCLQHLSRNYEVYIDGVDVTGIPFDIDFDREIDADEGAFLQIIYTVGNTTYSLIELDPVEFPYPKKFKASCTYEMINTTLKLFKIIPKVQDNITLDILHGFGIK